MNNLTDKRRFYIYLGLAFGIAWVFGLIVFLTGGIVNSPEIIPGSKITLALILVAIGYMWAPALAHIFTRLITHQGWGDLNLKLNFKKGWKFWLAAWIGPAILTILGAAVYFLVIPNQFDPNLTVLQKMMSTVPGGKAMDPWIIITGQVISAVLVAPVINSFFTFGEEFGWRGYMFPYLLQYGQKKAYLISGVIWGLWHAPVIAMGHNYGLDYPGFPWLGILMMVWFCLLAGTFLGWVSLKSNSVWPAVVGHAGINGIAGLGIYFAGENPNLLLGPTPVGLIGSCGYLIAFCCIFFLTKRDTAN